MKLIVISRPRYHKGESKMLNTLMDKHEFVLHLRKPKGSRDKMKRLLDGIDDKHYKRIVLHDHFDLVDDFDVAGVCLNKRSGLAHGKAIARSLHTLKEDEKLPETVQYVLISPVFDSISKSGYKSVITDKELFEGELNAFKDATGVEVMALGGVSQSKVQTAHEMGFDGVAVLGYLWRSMQHEDGAQRVDEKLLGLGKKISECDLVS